MGYNIGMPSLKLSNVQGKGGKHCGNFKKVAEEALEERYGKDLDINREISDRNVTVGFRTARELKEYSDRHIEQMNAERAERGDKKIRSDAVVMCSTIFKPPIELMSQLTEEQQNALLDDMRDIFKEFVGEKNIKSAVRHNDERNKHDHIFWEPITEDGRLCAKEMHNLKFFRKLNQEMPKQLRERGWHMIDDCQIYDKAEEDKKREEMGEKKYREYRKELKAKRGRDSTTFKHEKEQEIQQLENVIEEKQTELENLQNKALEYEPAPMNFMDKLNKKGYEEKVNLHQQAVAVKQRTSELDSREEQFQKKATSFVQHTEEKVNELSQRESAVIVAEKKVKAEQQELAQQRERFIKAKDRWQKEKATEVAREVDRLISKRFPNTIGFDSDSQMNAYNRETQQQAEQGKGHYYGNHR